jgi:hypothetical protein
VAPLRVRALMRASVRVNGTDALETDAANWKAERNTDVAALLRQGENEIEVRVENEKGPPALWLALELPGRTIATDSAWVAEWAGSAKRPAASASDPMFSPGIDPLGRIPSGPRGLALRWREALLGLGLSAGLAMLGIWLRRRNPGWPIWSERSPWPARLAAGAGAAAWAALFAHDAPWVPSTVGYDWSAHLDYVRHVLERGALPFAEEGWQMFQGPLYYLVAAATIWARGSPAVGPAEVAAVRAIGLVVGVAQIILVGANLRLLFPEQPRRQLLGVVFLVALPVMIYMHLVPGNEPLAAALVSGAFLVTLLRLRRTRPSLPLGALVGVLLGLATLTKVSAVLVAVPVLGALLARAFAGPGPSRRASLAETAMACAAFVATCGWEFARVWMRYGTPFVAGWGSRPGMGWWQDPGYRTLHDFLRFGRSLGDPAFAGYGGAWDGIYSTLWGDGMLSGGTDVFLLGPWWSPSGFSASLLLALVPTAAAVLGFGLVLRAWWRSPSAPEGMILSSAVVLLAALLEMAIRVPSVVSLKASYGMMGLVPLCAFVAVGFDEAMGGSGKRVVAVSAVFGAWAVVSFGTYWVDDSSFDTRLGMAVSKIEQGHLREGVRDLSLLAGGGPGAWPARAVLGQVQLDLGAPVEQISAVLGREGADPDPAVMDLLRSRLAARTGEPERALAGARRAVARAPDYLPAWTQLAELLTAADERQAAVEAWRQVLARDAFSVPAHESLAMLYGRLDDTVLSERHARYTRSLKAQGSSTKTSNRSNMSLPQPHGR